MKWVVSRAALVLLSLSVTLTGLEVAVRILGIAPPVLTQYGDNVRDALIVFRRSPGSTVRGRAPSGEFDFEYTHNRLGFRDTEHSIEKPRGVFRIVALGDSFTYGAGAAFADTYLAQVEHRLSARPGDHPRVEIIKLGLPRHFPLLERLTLENYGLQFGPDLVLVALLPNDVIDTYQGLAAVCASETGYLISCAAEHWGGAGIWLYIRSALGRLLLQRWSSRQGRQAPWDTRGMFRDDGPFEAEWRTIEDELERMRQGAQQHGAAFVVVSIPQEPPWTDAHAYPDIRLARWSVGHAATFIPTLPALRAASASTPLYWQRDGHCTPAGYAVIAEAIVSTLTAQGLVP